MQRELRLEAWLWQWLLILVFLAGWGCDSADPPPGEQASSSREQETPDSAAKEEDEGPSQSELVKQYLSQPQASSPADSVPSVTDQLVKAAPKANLKYEVPEEWAERPTKGLRAVNFWMHTPGGIGECYGVLLRGDGGDEPANVNQWRSEVGMPPLKEASEIEAYRRTANFDSGEFTIYEFLPEAPGLAVVVAMHRRNSTTWYFKMRGAKAALVHSLDPFQAFLESLEFEGE